MMANPIAQTSGNDRDAFAALNLQRLAASGAQAQNRFLDLKKRMAEMNFKGQFGAEAMDVVEFLVTEHATLSSSYRQVQDKESRLASDLALAQAQLFPLRKENARLARENHQLHVDNVKQSEIVETMRTEQAIVLRQMDDQISEQRYLAQIKEEQLKRSEVDRERLREAFDALSSKSAVGMRRMIQVTGHNLPPSMHRSGGGTGAGFSSSPSHSVDIAIIDSLRKQLEQADLGIKKVEAENLRLSACVNARENELVRTSNFLNGADGDFNVAQSSRMDQLIAADSSNRRIIDQLNAHVDFLNEQLAMRESQLVEAADKVAMADSLTIQMKQTNRLLDQERASCSEMTAQLIAMERKFNELSEAIDPEGSVSVDDLVERMSDRVSLHDDRLAPVQYIEPISKATVVVTKGKHLTPSSPASSIASFRQRGGNVKENVKEKQHQNNKPVESRSGGRDSDVVFSKLAAEREGLVSNVQALNDTVDSLQNGDIILRERLKRGEERIVVLKAELDDTKQQLAVVQRGSDEHATLIMRLRAEIHEKQVLTNSLESKLNERSTRSYELTSQVRDVEGAIEDSRRECEGLRALLETMKLEMAQLRKERAELVSVHDDATSRLSLMGGELLKLQQKYDSVRSELNDERVRGVTLCARSDELEGQLRAEKVISGNAKASADVIISSAQTQLMDRTTELMESKQELALFKSKLQGDASRSGSSVELEAQMREQLTLFEGERKQLLYEKDSLARELQVLTTLKGTNDQVIFEYSQNLAVVQSEMSKKDEELSGMRSRLLVAEMNYDRATSMARSLEDECALLRNTLEDKLSHNQLRSATSDHLQSEIALGEKRLAEASNDIANARDAAKDAYNAHSIAVERANRAELEVRTLSDALVVCNCERDKSDALCADLRDQISKGAYRAGSEKDELRRCIAEKQILESKVQEFQLLISSMESNTRNVALKGTRLSSALETSQDQVEVLQHEVERLAECVRDREINIRDLQQSLRSLDEERDRLQSQLDTEEENGSERDKGRQQQENLIFNLRKVVEKSERKIQSSSAELTASQRQCTATEARLQSLREECLELKRRLAQKSAEVGGTAEDLLLMTRENQALTSELSETASERDRLRQRVSEVVQAIASLEQSRRAIEMERQDLLDSYRAVLHEKRRLESELHAVGEVKQRAGASVNVLHSQVAELKGLVTAQSTAEGRWGAERTALHQQQEALHESLVSGQHRIDAIEADNRRMMQESHSLRQTNSMLNERVQMIMKRASACADANKVLSTRLLAVERERDAVRAMIAVERQRATEMSQVAQTARLASMSRDILSQRTQNTGSTVGVGASSTPSGGATFSADVAALSESLGLSNEEDSME